MDGILQILSDPALAASAIALLAVIRGLGELFEKLGQIGKQKQKENWLDNAGTFLMAIAGGLGRFFNSLVLAISKGNEPTHSRDTAHA